jgi:hypothetical protein
MLKPDEPNLLQITNKDIEASISFQLKTSYYIVSYHVNSNGVEEAVLRTIFDLNLNPIVNPRVRGVSYNPGTCVQ